MTTNESTAQVESDELTPKDAGTPAPLKRQSKLSKILPTDRIAFSKQCEIIRAYPAAHEKMSGPVANADVAPFVEMAPATVSQGNAFLTEVAIITKEGGKFVPSPELQSLFRLFPINEERAWAKLAPLFERAWFGLTLIPKLKFRPMTEEEAIHDLVEVATAEKDHIPQLRTILDFMVLVGLIQRDGGQIRLANHNGSPKDDLEKPKGELDRVVNPPGPDTAEDGLERYTLTLDAKSKRRIVLHAPPTIRKAELKRIQSWLEFQLLVSDPETGKPEATS